MTRSTTWLRTLSNRLSAAAGTAAVGQQNKWRRLRPSLLLLPLIIGCGQHQRKGPVGSTDADANTTPGLDASPSPDAPPGTPDLSIDRDRLHADLAVRERTFSADACELTPEEACVAAPGLRKLLYFSVQTPNTGSGDLVLGRPDSSENYQWSTCHMHYHLKGYAEYQLLDSDGNEVAVGHKQAFCLVDSEPYTDDPTISTLPRYSCAYQGLQRGWSDTYASNVPCQFVDITDTAPGDYQLHVQINTERAITEESYDNNTISIPVTIGASDLQTPTEPCPALADRALTSSSRECGWSTPESFSCTPETLVNVGCAASCNLGTCDGDPMLRVCDGADPHCVFASSLGSSNDECGGQCPAVARILCPTNGSLTVLHGARTPGATYSCTVSVVPAAR